MYPRDAYSRLANHPKPVRGTHASRVPARASRPGLFACTSLLLAAAIFGGGCWPTPQSSPVALAAGPASPDTVSITCAGGELREIIDKVARHFGLRIDYPADLHGHTSINLRDVTWRQIFKVTLFPVGYDFYERDGVIVIRLAEEIRALPSIAAESALRHQRPSAVAAYLRRLDPVLAATVVATSTGISYQVHPKQLENIRAAIARVDSPDVSLDKYARPARLPEALPDPLPPAPSADAANQPLTTQVFTVEHIDAFLVRPYLERELKNVPAARVLPDIHVNALIVTAPEPFMPRLEAIVTYLDDPRWHQNPRPN